MKKKHNADIMRKGFLIEMYIGGLPHEPYFIALTLQGKIIIGSTKNSCNICGWRFGIARLNLWGYEC